jgi:hypothetical protein
VGGSAQDPFLRLACSITAGTCSRAPDRVTVSKKSQTSRAAAWERRKTGPSSGTALGRRVDPGLLQDLPDGRSRDLHPEHQRVAAYPAIPVLLEYSIEQLTCAAASRLDAGMVG